ncbi:MAG: hypothetical protein ACK4N5_23940, partial [Myxococcales bacterium]
MFTLITGAEVYDPAPRGRVPVLLGRERLERVGGEVDADAIRRAGFACEHVDGSGLLLLPGLVDPHAHLIGTGGEQGFKSRTSDIPLEELVSSGITTVVGCLGTDDSTRTMPALVARARQLTRCGITAYVYTGSFHLPPPTLTGSVRNDLLFIPEVLGVGEVAIADFRSTEPSGRALAQLVSDAKVGGLLGEKVGLVHFHVGPGKRRLGALTELLVRTKLPPQTDQRLRDIVAHAQREGAKPQAIDL